jgi:catechol 2,3-dioxygenase-like lactoylglutathione lyase family enzyme
MQATTLPSLKLSFDAVFYYVADLERSIAFYRDALGLPLVSKDFVARFDIDGVLFELVPAHRGQTLSGTGNARLCLQVKDIRQTIADLQLRGVSVSEAKAETGGLLAFFNDPDGNELCLWEYVREKQMAGRG